MIDPIERTDALKEISEFRNGIFHDENLRRDNKHDWEAAYTMGKLHDAIYKLPRAMPTAATQIEKEFKGWGEAMHICSNCGKIVPFIDWCQPYCSGCGALFDNWQNYCAEDPELEEGEEEKVSEYVGNIGEHVEVKVSAVKLATSWEGMYGITYIWKITDEAGNIYT